MDKARKSNSEPCYKVVKGSISGVVACYMPIFSGVRMLWTVPVSMELDGPF